MNRLQSNKQPRRFATNSLVIILCSLWVCGILSSSAAASLGLEEQLPADEYDALVDLYYSTSGSSWVNSVGWLDGTASDWHGVNVSGVTTDAQGKVITKGHVFQLSLPGNRLSGMIPPTLQHLSQLSLLNLANNQLTGTIPESLGSLSELVFLVLQGNQLTGSVPPTLANLRKVLHFDLATNNLSGTIPPGVCALPEIQLLILSSNALSGSIPDTFVSPNLILVSLNLNQLTGNIPSMLANLSQVALVDLSTNILTGDVPLFHGVTKEIVRLAGNWLNIGAGSQSLQNINTMQTAGKQLSYKPQGLGFDISLYSAVPTVDYCTRIQWKGFHYAIVGGWAGDSPNPHARAQLTNARSSGLITAGYCLLKFKSAYDGARQVRNALAQFGPEARYLGFLALDVEAAPDTFTHDQDLLQQAVDEVDRYGLTSIIYANKTYWNSILGAAFTTFNSLPLWEPRTLNGYDITLPDLSSPAETFGGWTSRAGKQYILTTSLDGLNVDLNVFERSAFADSNPHYVPLDLTLNVVLTGNTLTLSWTDPGVTLEEATNPNGPWIAVQGATSPFVAQIAGTQHYYRVR